MEIKNALTKNLDPYRTRLDAKAEAAAARAKGAVDEPVAAAQGDRVSLSPSARLHTLAHTEASKAPEVRQNIVNGLKERVAAGEYDVDAKKIAEKLVESESLLAGTLGGE